MLKPFIALTALVGLAQSLERRDTSELASIRAQVNALTLEQSNPPQTSQWLTTLQPDGSFSDVNYAAGCAGNAGTWGAYNHWGHIHDMAVSWASGENGTSYQNSTSLMTSISSAMDYWFKNDYTNEACTFANTKTSCPCTTPGLWAINWWWNVIGVPKTAGTACLLVSDQLNATQIQGCQRITNRPFHTLNTETGANLIDVSLGSVYYGLLSQNASTVVTAFEQGNSALSITAGRLDGIKADGSFFQHGGLLASGSYGAPMLQGFLNLQYYSVNTTYQANATQQMAFATVLNGSQWMLFSNTTPNAVLWDYSVTGRSISRPGAATDLAVNLSQAIESTTAWSSGNEIAAIAKSVLTSTGDANQGPLNGNRMFYYGDYMVHRRSNYIVTLKMTTNRTLAEECVNAENTKGFHLSDGTIYTYLTGDEYHYIFPTWDWNLIPGTTIDYNGTPNNCTAAYFGAQAFGGGASNGQIGVAAQTYLNPKTKDFSWKKSWFFLDDFYVVLGSNITEARPNAVFSTLDQRKLNGPVHINSASKAAISGTYTDVKWLHHDNIGYQMIDLNTNVNLSTVVQTGTWQSIGDYNGTVSIPIFNAKIPHQQQASQVVQNASLGYVVYPGMSLSNFTRRTRSPPVSVIQRDDTAHIIKVPRANFAGAVFWTQGSANNVPLFGIADTAIQVDNGIIMASITDKETSTLMIADPTHLLTSLQLNVTIPNKNITCGTSSAYRYLKAQQLDQQCRPTSLWRKAKVKMDTVTDTVIDMAMDTEDIKALRPRSHRVSMY